MDQASKVRFCKDLGCCDACCIRYLGLKAPSSYENVHQFILRYIEQLTLDNNEQDLSNSLTEEKTSGNHNHNQVSEETNTLTAEDTNTIGVLDHLELGDDETNNGIVEGPPTKRIKLDNICVSCLGVLQEETWPECFAMVREVLDKKHYECESIACALSSPIAAILRERVITLHLEHTFPGYDNKTVMPLKEAWKWTFGRRLAKLVGKQLDSGAVSPLLVTVSLEYPEELQELEVVRQLAPAQFASRTKQRRRFAVEFTRRAIDQALDGASSAALKALTTQPPLRPAAPARPVSVQATHAPLYLGGRYVKLNRALPQTPWLVGGRRMLHSSVQEIIFEPLADVYGLSREEAEQQLKLMSAGREDVDVRCLGTGRPFAVEISDPRRRPSAEELARACELISGGGKVIVNALVPVSREQLTLLKEGEQTKCKTYEALCVKLNGPVSERDITSINTYRNTPPDSEARVELRQRTPLRVLHRRPLLERTRRVWALSARAVPDAPNLFVVRVKTEAGTYVKEWVHGELRRTRPSLAAALPADSPARTDILALDVLDVELPWPPTHTQ